METGNVSKKQNPGKKWKTVQGQQCNKHAWDNVLGTTLIVFNFITVDFWNACQVDMYNE